MKHYFLLSAMWCVVLCLNAGKAQAQFPTYTPPRIPVPTPNMPVYYGRTQSPEYRKADGAYQLADGTWEAGELVFDGAKLTVKLPAGQKNLTLYPPDLKQVAFPQDTFLVIRDFWDPQKNTVAKANFAHRELHEAGYELFTYTHTLYAGPVFLLRQSQGELQLVPKSKKELRAFMAALVGESPEVLARVNQGEYKYQDVPKLLQEYIDTKIVKRRAGQ